MTLTKKQRSDGGKVTVAMGGGNCPHCGEYKPSRMSLLGHISIVHSGSGGDCDKCGEHFDTRAALAGHLGLHGVANEYFDGDLEKTKVHFAYLGAISGDGPSYRRNGAFKRGYELRDRINDAKMGADVWNL